MLKLYIIIIIHIDLLVLEKNNIKLHTNTAGNFIHLTYLQQKHFKINTIDNSAYVDTN